MNIANWIPALSTTSLLALFLWLFRALISTRLTKSVENEFSSKLEKLKSDLRQKETTIESLRNGAMSGLMSRQAKLYERQLQAIEQVWESVTELKKAKFISSIIAVMKYDSTLEEASKNPDFRKIFKMLGGDFDTKKINLGAATKARPFLSPLSWAYYNAYESIITINIMKFEFLKIGVENSQNLIKSKDMVELLKIVLPDRTEYLEQHGDRVTHYLLDEIESLLLTSLKEMQKGNVADHENTERAAEILKASNKLMEKFSSEKIKG
ncbi:MAG TPA: hypothetical protein ENI88_11965 [Desulfobulbus sp.]|nr:hypothetical protein [Desulfobulbus sp.]